MSGIRVLILADTALGPAMGDALRAHGFGVEATSAVDAALALASGIGFDVAVVDRSILGKRASAVIARLRRVLEAPLCLLVAGRSVGRLVADAVVEKPVRVPVLAGIVRELTGNGGSARIGGFVFRPATRGLYDVAKKEGNPPDGDRNGPSRQPPQGGRSADFARRLAPRRLGL